MENKEIKDYKEERFEFTVYVNDNIICKRNFRIFNYIENSMNTLEFKEKLDEIVRLIDDDLKSKSLVLYLLPGERIVSLDDDIVFIETYNNNQHLSYTRKLFNKRDISQDIGTFLE